MLEPLAAEGRRKAIAIGALALVLGALALQPGWLIGMMKTIYEGFFGLFLAGWLC